MAGIAQTLSSPIIIIFVYLWCEVNTLLHCIGLVSILWPEDRKAIKFVWAEDTQLIEGSITQSIARKWKTGVLGSQYQNMTREFGGGGGSVWWKWSYCIMFLVSRESKWNGWNLFDDIGLTFLEMYIETMIGKQSMFFMCEDIYVWQC